MENKEAFYKTVGNTCEFGLRLFCGIFVFIYGIMKPWQFAHYEAYDVPIDELHTQLGGFSLMWYFFAYSKTVPIIVGLFECSGAILIVFNKTRLIGASILLPVLSAIVLFDFVFEVHDFATANAVAYFLVCSLILFMNRTAVFSAIQKLLVNNESDQPGVGISFRQSLLLVVFLSFNWLAIQAIHWFVGGF